VWSRVESLPLFYALWIGLGARQAVILLRARLRGDHAGLRPALQAGDPADDLLGGLASTFSIPFAQLLIERIGWRPTLEVMAAINLGVALLIHWSFIPGPHERPVPIAEISYAGRGHDSRRVRWRGRPRAGLWAWSWPSRAKWAGLLRHELPPDPLARGSSCADQHGDGDHRADRVRCRWWAACC
jgi:hypothetical protein